MTDIAQTADDTSRSERHRAWSRRVEWATLSWAVVQGGFALVCGLGGTPLSGSGSGQGAVWLGWFVVVVATLAAVATTAALRGADRPAVRVVLWVACGLSTVSAFSLLMDVVGLLFAQGVDNPETAVLHVLGLLGAVLLATTAQARRFGTCTRCGAVHETVTRPQPSRAPRCSPGSVSSCSSD
ncbi:hypothetical protein ACWC2K_36135 [Streptomyces chattanoogensis]